jgi:hypothetical protein
MGDKGHNTSHLGAGSIREHQKVTIPSKGFFFFGSVIGFWGALSFGNVEASDDIFSWSQKRTF